MSGKVVDGSNHQENRPTFDTDQVVNWNCPVCGEPGYDHPKTANYYPTCNESDCPVRMFTVFRGEQ